LGVSIGWAGPGAGGFSIPWAPGPAQPMETPNVR
jgi:hypothetical protein